MTINEAYNKGLDVAENEALEKLSKALDGLDAGAFANPKLEEFRQRVLNTVKCEESPDDTNIPYDEEMIGCSELSELLLAGIYNDSYKSNSSKGRVISAISELIQFITERAAKNNNGSKNYIKMVEIIRSHLLTPENNVLK